MTEKGIFIIVGYFTLEGLWLTALTMRSNPKTQVYTGWVRFLAHLVITGAILALILTKTIRYASVGISVLAIYEVFQLALRQQLLNNKNFLLAFPMILFMVYDFLWYADHLPMELQLYTYILVFCFDGFSQLTGQLPGRHKLAPALSSGKTIEGVVGGFLLAGLTAFVLGTGMPLAIVVLFWTGTCVFALAGDLYTLYCKRVLKVKHYSNLIPGHGGVLDHFGSLFGATVFLYFLSYFIPITF